MEIADIKNRLEITEVARQLGIEINPRTKRATCPFHNDKTPSLQFSPEKQICTCFSSNCTAGTMDVIGLTEKYKSISTHEALKYLSSLAGEIIISKSKEFVKQTNPDILTSIFSYFYKGFIGRKDNKGRTYLRSRGLDVDKLENLGIRIGYNSAQFHHRGRINKEEMQACEQVGLLIKSNNGSKTENSFTPWAGYCVIFPLIDENGAITGLYGRSTLDSKGKHFYLKNSKGLFYCPKQETQKLIITESIIDFLSLYQIDELRNQYDFLPIYGTNRLNAEHRNIIRSLEQLQEIIFFLDGDKAGNEAVEKYSKELSATLSGVEVSKVETPEGEDINSLLVAHEKEIFAHLLENRKTVSSFLSSEISVEKKNGQISESSNQQISSSLLITDNCSLNTDNPHKLSYATQNIIYYIKGGLGKVLDSMKVTLEIEPLNTTHYKRKSRTKLDLYEDKQVSKVAREAGEKLGIRAELIELELNDLTDLLDEYREKQLTGNSDQLTVKNVQLTLQEKERCQAFLKQEKLIDRINNLIGQSGVVGEENNRIFLFGIASSYKMEETLHALIQGSSGSGKTHLLATIMDFMPPEDTISLTRVTESSFYNYGQYELQNKLIGMEDYDGLEEKAELAFRELQSKGMISAAPVVRTNKQAKSQAL